MKTFFFAPDSFFILIIGFALLFISIVSFEILKKSRLSLFLLIISGLFLCSFVALLDPFLNNWDEAFHALVAKNLLLHPFVPTLFDKPVISYEFTNWCANHVWLHKQPLFLWQMAISIKLFGMNEFAVRIPSILMMSILPIFIYRIGKISLNERIGYYGALLFCSAYFVHESLTGFPSSDHNDIAFLFYITLSIWAWVEYENSQKTYWLILIGLFSGCAILVKWLTGLLVFSGWGLSIIFDKERRNSFSSYKNILLSLIICAIVFIPWQIYIIRTFPNESMHEYSLNAKHFTNVVEDHGGDAWYYFDNLRKIYGGAQWVQYAILLSLIFLFKNISKKKYKIAFFSFIFIVYSFFSMAATKMVSFCFIVSPIVFLSLASLVENFIIFLKNKLFNRIVVQHFIVVVLLFIIAWLNLDLHQIAYKHTLLITQNDNDKRSEKINDAIFIKAIINKLSSEDYVIFNCKPQRNISIMFYTNFIAYDRQLDYANYLILKKKRIKLAVIDNKKLPEFIINDSEIIKIQAPDKTWEN